MWGLQASSAASAYIDWMFWVGQHATSKDSISSSSGDTHDACIAAANLSLANHILRMRSQNW
jgi:hypothetical protein